MNVKRYKNENPYSYTLGATLTIEALKKRPELVKRIFIHSKLNSLEIENIIKTEAGKHKIPLEYNDKPFHILSEKENCYVIGEFRKFDCELDKNAKHIVLVSPSNFGNLGTIIRTAVGFNMKNLALIRPAVDIFNPQTVRASMGALFNINFRYFNSFEEYLAYAGKRDCFPFMLQGKKSLAEMKFPKICSLIFGNEATGLPESFLGIGEPIIIRHSSEIDSLNLPVAVSIALYEASKDKFH
ncbi:MAG TPA: TrmH family RNA methyltransferase [Bacilli bacterium]